MSPQSRKNRVPVRHSRARYPDFEAGRGLATFLWIGAVCLLFAVLGCDRGELNPNPEPKKPPDPTATVSPSTGGALLPLHEVTSKTGIDFTYRNGHEAGHCAIVESLGGGLGMIDFDGDHDLDLFFPGGGHYGSTPETLTTMSGYPGALYRNEGQWAFSPVTEAAGVGDAPYYTHGVSSGDFDNDGFIDFVVTGYGGLRLFHNLGDGSFEEVSAPCGMTDKLWSSSAGWADLNGDGDLDLYVAHYVDWSFQNHPFCKGPKPPLREICSPKYYSGLPDTLYYSNGDGSFRDVSKEVGLSLDLEWKIAGKGLGVMLGDVDMDGDVDIYVANDTVLNFLYLNDGRGKFKEEAHLNGCSGSKDGMPEGSMGVDLGDYDGDGLPDIFVANYERETFAMYHNNGRALFRHVSEPTGMSALGKFYVGFGALFIDIDRDGDEDIVVSNGHVINYPSDPDNVLQNPLMLINDRGRRFQPAKFDPEEYFAKRHRGRGVVAGDLDGDGDPDLAFSHTNAPVAVVANDIESKGSWLNVKLVGARSNRDAVGAKLLLSVSTAKRPLLRQIKGGCSYLSQSDRRAYFGIPEGATITGLEIRWPSGITQRIEPSATPINSHLTFVEPPEVPADPPKVEKP